MSTTFYTTKLSFLYGAEAAERVEPRLREIIQRYRGKIPGQTGAALTQRDALLITYGDQVSEPDRPPLQTLAEFCETHLRGLVNGIHLLPFYPWSSDDG